MMIYKTLFTILFVLGWFNHGKGQNWYHSIGFSGQQISLQALQYTYISNTQPAFERQYTGENKYYGNLSYHLRCKLYATDSVQFDLSLDLPMNLSAYWTNDDFENKNFVNLSIPLLLVANYGAYTFSKKKTKIPIGIFGGLGTLWQYTDGNLGNRTNFSPYSMIGIRFDFSRRYGLEFSYAQNHLFGDYISDQVGDSFYTPNFYLDKSVKLQSRTFSIRLIL